MQFSSDKLLHWILAALIGWDVLFLAAPFLTSSENMSLQICGAAIYFLADPQCHQLPERSIYLNGVPLPVCVRCLFIYLGGTLAFILAVTSIQRYLPPFRYLLIGLILIATGLALEKLMSVYNDFTTLRGLSGFLLGLILGLMLREAITQTASPVKRNF